MSRLLRPLALVAVLLVTLGLTVRADGAMERLRLFCGKAADLAHAHGAGPVAIAAPQPAGPYQVALWARPDVGAGVVYVVLTPIDGRPFIAPRDVRVAIRALSGTDAERQYHAFPEPVARGARFIAAVPLTRVDRWRVRVLLDGAMGPAQLQATFASAAPASPGVAGLLLSAIPFVLVAGLWGPWRRVRRGRPATSPLASSSFTLTGRTNP